jgi:NADPH:quinone reductase-like Zn-dependent oxidoreductase
VVSLFVGQRVRGSSRRRTRRTWRALNELIEVGKVTPVLDRTYQLIEAPEAVRYLERGHPSGKVVVTV